MTIQEQLIGEKVALRMVCMEDCNDTYVQWMNDFETNYYMETCWNEQNLQTIREFVNGVMESGDSYLFAIMDISSGRHIGNIKIGPIRYRYKFADISYFIGDKEFRGKGCATEAIRLICEFGFYKLGLHRIEAGVIEGNIRSEKVLLANGFVEEGRLTHRFIREGKYLDHILFGKINAND